MQRSQFSARVLFVLLLSPLAFGPTAHGECVAELSTGYDSDMDALFAEGTEDSKYSVVLPDLSRVTPLVLFHDQFPIGPWAAGDPVAGSSLWIGATTNADGAGANAPLGTFAYEITIGLPVDIDASNARLVGQMSGDDRVADIEINGASTGLSAMDFTLLHTLPSTAGLGFFTPGENTLRFIVTNGGDVANPSGFRFEGCVDFEAVILADERPNDISTGLNEVALVTLENGSEDSDWSVVFTPDGGVAGDPTPAVVVNDDGFPIPPWMTSSPQSKWISTAADSNGETGTYEYTTTLVLGEDVDAEIAVIQGGVAADDEVVDLLVNAVSTGFTAAGFGALTPFPATLGRGLLTTGENTITLVVTNGGVAAGPTGLRVDAFVPTCPVPVEPIDTLPSVLSLDTGFSEAGDATIANAQADDNYQVFGLDGVSCRQAAVVINDDAFPIPPWIASTEQSKWIGLAADSNAPGGVAVFRTVVQVPAELEAVNLRMVGSWTSDNEGLDILVNGLSTGLSQAGSFNLMTEFPVDAGLGLFQAGDNIVEFLVNNAGAGPTGLRVEAILGQGVPPRDLSTGMGLRGLGPIPGGFQDGRYRIDRQGGAAPAPAFTLSTIPARWIPGAPGASWIGLDGEDSVGPVGTYVYEISFDIGRLNPEKIALEGGWAASTEGVDALLNGVSLGSRATDPSALSSFPEGAGRGAFLLGLNTLRFVVSNEEAGPMALLVDARFVSISAADGLDISTGFDETTAMRIDEGSLDDSYVVSPPGGAPPAAFVLANAPIPPWIENTVSSAWIGSPAGAVIDGGLFTYTTRVELSAEDAANARLVGLWTSDNSGQDVLVNGVSTGLSNAGDFGNWTAFPKDAGAGLFQEGANTIAFLVMNDGVEPNPGGLRVDARVDVTPASTGGGQVLFDCNQDGNQDLSDAVCVLGFFFLGLLPDGLPCGEPGGVEPDAGDALSFDWQGDGRVDLSDPVAMLGYLFLGRPPHVLDPGGLGRDLCLPIEGCPEVCTP